MVAISKGSNIKRLTWLLDLNQCLGSIYIGWELRNNTAGGAGTPLQHKNNILILSNSAVLMQSDYSKIPDRKLIYTTDIKTVMLGVPPLNVLWVHIRKIKLNIFYSQFPLHNHRPGYS